MSSANVVVCVCVCVCVCIYIHTYIKVGLFLNVARCHELEGSPSALRYANDIVFLLPIQ